MKTVKNKTTGVTTLDLIKRIVITSLEIYKYTNKPKKTFLFSPSS